MKNLRIKFQPLKQEAFIKEIYRRSGFSTLQLAELVQIHPRSLVDWKNGKLTMSLKAAEIFCKEFNISLPEKKEIMVQRWKLSQKKANIVGGIAAFKKYGCPATIEGRRKGGKKAIAMLREKGIVPLRKHYTLPSFNTDLAEYIGIMLGDGGMTATQSCITLNSEADASYITYVSQLAKNLFGENPKVYKHKNDKAIVLYYNGVSLVRYFISFGLKIGNKTKQQVDVPEWIKVSQEYRSACLRGLMDTDGGIFLHTYTVNGKIYSYKKMSFTNRSMPLLKFVFETLKELDFTSKIIDKVENKKVWLYNEQEVKQYLQIVGTHNARLLKVRSGGVP